MLFKSLIGLQMFLFASPLMAEGEDALPPRDQGIGQTVIMIAIALVFFYFILWRPEQKRRKAMEAQRSALKTGDKVTAVGIIGTVVKIQDHSVILKMYDGSKIEVVKGAISEIMPGNDKEEKVSSGKRVDIEDAE